jgi:hypothetical protein
MICLLLRSSNTLDMFAIVKYQHTWRVCCLLGSVFKVSIRCVTLWFLRRGKRNMNSMVSIMYWYKSATRNVLFWFVQHFLLDGWKLNKASQKSQNNDECHTCAHQVLKLCVPYLLNQWHYQGFEISIIIYCHVNVQMFWWNDEKAGYIKYMWLASPYTNSPWAFDTLICVFLLSVILLFSWVWEDYCWS